MRAIFTSIYYLLYLKWIDINDWWLRKRNRHPLPPNWEKIKAEGLAEVRRRLEERGFFAGKDNKKPLD